jgi:hypothetical protein
VAYHKTVSVAQVIERLDQPVAIEPDQIAIRNSPCIERNYGGHDWIDLTTVGDTVGVYYCIKCGKQYHTLTMPERFATRK